MAPLTRFGLRLPTVAPAGGAGALPRLVELAQAAEAGGFDSLWVPDRPGDVLEPGDGTVALEAHTALGALAARTSTARLGALVSPAGARAPSILAKQLTTLDVISGGRAVLGIGAGAAPPGAQAAAPSARFEELEDALRVCRAMFGAEVASVTGHRHAVRDAANRPQPLQPGGPPIVVGGNGERRTLPLAVAHADGCNLVGPAELLRERAAHVDRLCRAQGRERSDFTVTALVTAVVAPEAAGAASRMTSAGTAARSGPAPLVVLGTPDTVAGRLVALLDDGLDGLVVDVPADVDAESVLALGRALVSRAP